MEKEELIQKIQKETITEEILKSYIIENGSPIISDNETEEGLYTVIYVYISQVEESQKIHLIVPYDNGVSYQESILRQIPNSKIYYRIEKLPSDVYASYMFCINRDDFDDDTLWGKAFADKYCKGEIKFEEDGIISKRSYFKLPKAQERVLDKVMRSLQINKGTLASETINSNILGKQYTYDIYLPFQYQKEKEYTVLVLNDAEDYLVTMHVKELLDDAIQNNKIEDILVCFIHNQDRNLELPCNQKFARFIVEELFTDVEQKYTLKSLLPQNRIIGGLSYGGLCAMYIGREFSDKVANVLCESGSFWWNHENPTFEYVYQNEMLQQFQKKGKLPLHIYMNVGTIEMQDTMINTNKELYQYFKENNYHVKYEEFPSGHDYLYWADYLINGIQFLQSGLKKEGN